MSENPRIAELRRRVEIDPASSVFGQLAEEYRRAGEYREAINCCRVGLARHPGYLAARVTLGRSLLEVGQLDEAAHELEFVLRAAPDNLPALRAMAEIHQRRGALEAALEYYKRALALARFDAELETTVNQIDQELSAVKSSALVDFDTVLTSLGMPDRAAPPAVERLLAAASDTSDVAPAIVPDAPVSASADDPFAWLERELRAFEPSSSSSASSSPSADDAVLQELEAWLRAVVAARAQSPRA